MESRVVKAPGVYRRRALAFVVNLLMVFVAGGAVVALSEMVCGRLNAANVLEQRWKKLKVFDPLLSFRLKPDASVYDVCTRGTQVQFEARYSTNEHGRRNCEVEGEATREKFVAMFGCSFTFGLGLNDGETLASTLGRLAPKYMPYNFGCFGQGPQHVLLTLQEPIEREIAQQDGIAIYTFIVAHINRVIGGSAMVTQWGADFPHFEVDGDRLVRSGTFRTAHPRRQYVYELLQKSETLRYLQFTWPMRWSDADYALCARVVQEAAATFQRKWPGGKFYVLLYPDPKEAAVDEIMKKYFEKAGLQCLHYPGLIDSVDEKARTVDGGHPSAATVQVIAAKVVEDLGLDK